MASVVRASLVEMELQRERLEHERQADLARRQRLGAARQWVRDLEASCALVGQHVQAMSHRNTLVALDALGGQVRLYKRGHTRRHEITASIPLNAYPSPTAGAGCQSNMSK